MSFLPKVPAHATAVLLSSLLLFSGLLHGQTPGTRLRIGTANLSSGNFQKYETPGLNILKGLQPDIVAIQEFNYSNNTSADFRQMIDSTFAPSFSYFRETNSGFSIPNGIISRYPITDAGTWIDPVLSNRGFAWAKIALTPTNDLCVVSVHLYSSGTEADRNTEALTIKSQIQSSFPPNAWVIVAGDFNTSSRDEAAIGTFTTFLSDDPVPTDAESGGNPDTNENRSAPYDYVLPSFAMTNARIPLVLGTHSFSRGLVFDSRVYTPLSEVPPVALGDSGATGMQHMAVVKDFLLPFSVTSAAPSIVTQPQDQIVPLGSNATFVVQANGTPPLNYFWHFSGGPLVNATGSAYTRTNVQPADAGAYFVVVTNGTGSITSHVSTLTVSSAPYILSLPQNQSRLVGQDASFMVQASGPNLTYQWKFNGTSISNAFSSSYTRTNVQTNDAGEYSVVITNASGSTSAVAVLTVLLQSGSVLAQWNFNNTNASVASPPPTQGTGTVALVGGTTSAWVSGSGSTDTNVANNAWNTMNYPAQGTGNKTAGAQFNVSTVGRENISVRWDQRVSSTGSKYVRLQYTTNGSAFVDFPTATVENATATFEPKTNDLTGIAGVENNPSFGFRLVAEFESTAANTANASYVGVGGAYGTGGTVRLDAVTISGTMIAPTNPPPTPASLGLAGYSNGFFQFNCSGATGINYVIEGSTNLSPSSWTPLKTNIAPFNFVDPNAGLFPWRFYRAYAVP